MKWAFTVLIVTVLIAGAVFLILKPQLSGSGREDDRLSLFEAQRILGLIKRIEAAAGEEEGFIEASAVRKENRFEYSPGWAKLNMPKIRESLPFNFRCGEDGLCVAMEVEKGRETGSGIGCDAGTGAFRCYGAFQPVTTQGFNGTEIVVGCQS